MLTLSKNTNPFKSMPWKELKKSFDIYKDVYNVLSLSVGKLSSLLFSDISHHETGTIFPDRNTFVDQFSQKEFIQALFYEVLDEIVQAINSCEDHNDLKPHITELGKLQSWIGVGDCISVEDYVNGLDYVKKECFKKLDGIAIFKINVMQGYALQHFADMVLATTALAEESQQVISNNPSMLQQLLNLSTGRTAQLVMLAIVFFKQISTVEAKKDKESLVTTESSMDYKTLSQLGSEAATYAALEHQLSPKPDPDKLAETKTSMPTYDEDILDYTPELVIYEHKLATIEKLISQSGTKELGKQRLFETLSELRDECSKLTTNVKCYRLLIAALRINKELLEVGDIGDGFKIIKEIEQVATKAYAFDKRRIISKSKTNLEIDEAISRKILVLARRLRREIPVNAEIKELDYEQSINNSIVFKVLSAMPVYNKAQLLESTQRIRKFANEDDFNYNILISKPQERITAFLTLLAKQPNLGLRKLIKIAEIWRKYVDPAVFYENYVTLNKFWVRITSPDEVEKGLDADYETTMHFFANNAIRLEAYKFAYVLRNPANEAMFLRYLDQLEKRIFKDELVSVRHINILLDIVVGRLSWYKLRDKTNHRLMNLFKELKNQKSIYQRRERQASSDEYSIVADDHFDYTETKSNEAMSEDWSRFITPVLIFFATVGSMYALKLYLKGLFKSKPILELEEFSSSQNKEEESTVEIKYTSVDILAFLPNFDEFNIEIQDSDTANPNNISVTYRKKDRTNKVIIYPNVRTHEGTSDDSGPIEVDLNRFLKIFIVKLKEYVSKDVRMNDSEISINHSFQIKFKNISKFMMSDKNPENLKNKIHQELYNCFRKTQIEFEQKRKEQARKAKQAATKRRAIEEKENQAAVLAKRINKLLAGFDNIKIKTKINDDYSVYLEVILKSGTKRISILKEDGTSIDVYPDDFIKTLLNKLQQALTIDPSKLGFIQEKYKKIGFTTHVLKLKSKTEKALKEQEDTKLVSLAEGLKSSLNASLILLKEETSKTIDNEKPATEIEAIVDELSDDGSSAQSDSENSDTEDTEESSSDETVDERIEQTEEEIKLLYQQEQRKFQQRQAMARARQKSEREDSKKLSETSLIEPNKSLRVRPKANSDDLKYKPDGRTIKPTNKPKKKATFKAKNRPSELIKTQVLLNKLTQYVLKEKRLVASLDTEEKADNILNIEKDIHDAYLFNLICIFELDRHLEHKRMFTKIQDATKLRQIVHHYYLFDNGENKQLLKHCIDILYDKDHQRLNFNYNAGKGKVAKLKQLIIDADKAEKRDAINYCIDLKNALEKITKYTIYINAYREDQIKHKKLFDIRALPIELDIMTMQIVKIGEIIAELLKIYKKAYPDKNSLKALGLVEITHMALAEFLPEYKDSAELLYHCKLKRNFIAHDTKASASANPSEHLIGSKVAADRMFEIAGKLTLMYQAKCSKKKKPAKPRKKATPKAKKDTDTSRIRHTTPTTLRRKPSIRGSKGQTKKKPPATKSTANLISTRSDSPISSNLRKRPTSKVTTSVVTHTSMFAGSANSVSNRKTTKKPRGKGPVRRRHFS